MIIISSGSYFCEFVQNVIKFTPLYENSMTCLGSVCVKKYTWEKTKQWLTALAKQIQHPCLFFFVAIKAQVVLHGLLSRRRQLQAASCGSFSKHWANYCFQMDYSTTVVNIPISGFCSDVILFLQLHHRYHHLFFSRGHLRRSPTSSHAAK